MLKPRHHRNNQPQRLAVKVFRHWSQQVNESVISGGPQGKLSLKVEGGAENGRFCYMADIHHERIIYHSGRLVTGENILEVQGQKIPGFTLWDLEELLRSSSRHGAPVILKTIPADSIPADLRDFLSQRFQKNSVDHDLQQTIRNNLYKRTVPCTTRPPRPGEVNHADYTFLTVEEFTELEKSGKLLESGVYDGHRYGTPKPPKEPSPQTQDHTNSSISSVQLSPNGSKSSAGDDPSHLGPLPTNWEMAYTDDGTPYFIDHNTETTHWLDPRLAKGKKLNPTECNENELPFGWEKVDDPHFGVYYIDHINRKTQYENPVEEAKKQASPRISIEPAPVNGERKKDHVTPSIEPPVYPVRPFFTKNPDALRGQFLKTSLVKSNKGFGFTILGGDNRDEEFLQIKNIVAGGPAYADGKLKPGDVLVFVDSQCVLGFTHNDVFSLFKSIPVGEQVTLEVCRGYKLPFDPDTEIIREVALTLPSDAARTDSYGSGTGSEGEMLLLTITKGTMGFGFTIADSPQGQKVRQILDNSRCSGLREGDVLLEIGGRRVRDVPHQEVVQLLKDCQQGQEIQITVQRGEISVTGPITTDKKKELRIHTGEGDTGSLEGAFPESSHTKTIQNTQPDVLVPHTRVLPPSFPAEPVFRSNRSRTPGPDFMRGVGDEYPVPALRSKTPTHELQSSPRQPLASSGTPNFVPASAYNKVQPRREHVYPPVSRPVSQPDLSTRLYHQSMPTSQSVGRIDTKRQSTSFEHSEPVAVDQSRLIMPSHMEEMTVTLRRTDSGFGFRILGGTEEGSQVTVGKLVPNGAADADGRLCPGDEILSVNGEMVLGSTHHYVVQLMSAAAKRGQVTLVVRRRLPTDPSPRPPLSPGMYPYDVRVLRRPEEGFGFVIISSITKAGAVLGRIIEGSPAERCGKLKVGDRILAVNSQPISRLHHEDIVTIIKESGLSVTLTIGPPADDVSPSSPGNIPKLPSPGYPTTRPDPRQFNQPIQEGAPLHPLTLLATSSRTHPGVFDITLFRGARGFGFSIRGGQEFNNMPLFILKVAPLGAADEDGNLQVGDQILEINGLSTLNMTHARAIELIQTGGNCVRLRLKRTGEPPPNIGVGRVITNHTSNGPTFVGPISQSSPNYLPDYRQPHY